MARLLPSYPGETGNALCKCRPSWMEQGWSQSHALPVSSGTAAVGIVIRSLAVCPRVASGPGAGGALTRAAGAAHLYVPLAPRAPPKGFLCDAARSCKSPSTLYLSAAHGCTTAVPLHVPVPMQGQSSVVFGARKSPSKTTVSWCKWWAMRRRHRTYAIHEHSCGQLSWLPSPTAAAGAPPLAVSCTLALGSAASWDHGVCTETTSGTRVGREPVAAAPLLPVRSPRQSPRSSRSTRGSVGANKKGNRQSKRARSPPGPSPAPG